jgi:hypothetical protein
VWNYFLVAQFRSYTHCVEYDVMGEVIGSSDRFQVVQRQVKLESGKGAVDMFVIDSVQRPSEN